MKMGRGDNGEREREVFKVEDELMITAREK